jgi:hypothetical protein
MGSTGISDIYSSETPTFYHVTDGKSFAVLLQSISGISAINPLVAFYDIHEGKREVLFFYFAPDTTQDDIMHFIYN